MPWCPLSLSEMATYVKWCKVVVAFRLSGFLMFVDTQPCSREFCASLPTGRQKYVGNVVEAADCCSISWWFCGFWMRRAVFSLLKCDLNIPKPNLIDLPRSLVIQLWEINWVYKSRPVLLSKAWPEAWRLPNELYAPMNPFLSNEAVY